MTHGPWVLGPAYRDDPAFRDAAPPVRTVLEAFHEDGYVVVPGAVDPATVRGALTATAAEYRRRSAGTERVLDAWRWRSGIRALAVHPPLVTLVELLLGRPAVAFQTLSFRRGTQQRAHADSIHFDTVPSGFTCGVWVALEDVADDQGPLVVHPGSHRRPLGYPAALGLDPDAFDTRRYEDLVAERMSDLPPRRLTLAAGDAVVWAADLVHGGAPVAQAGSTRWSQVTHYFGRGMVYVTPQRSAPEEGRYLARDPLVDVRTVRPVRHPGRESGVRLVRHRDGSTTLLPAQDPGPSLVTRAGSAALGAGRLARWYAAAVRDRVQRPVRR